MPNRYECPDCERASIDNHDFTCTRGPNCIERVTQKQAPRAMTPQQFKAARKACGMTLEAWFKAVAPERKDTGKKQIVHQWETGRMVLPPDVAERARALWQEAAKKSLIDSHGA